MFAFYLKVKWKYKTPKNNKNKKQIKSVPPDTDHHKSHAHSRLWKHGTSQKCVPSHGSLCCGGPLCQNRMDLGPSHLKKHDWWWCIIIHLFCIFWLSPDGTIVKIIYWSLLVNLHLKLKTIVTWKCHYIYLAKTLQNSKEVKKQTDFKSDREWKQERSILSGLLKFLYTLGISYRKYKNYSNQSYTFFFYSTMKAKEEKENKNPQNTQLRQKLLNKLI